MPLIIYQQTPIMETRKTKKCRLAAVIIEVLNETLTTLTPYYQRLSKPLTTTQYNYYRNMVQQKDRIINIIDKDLKDQFPSPLKEQIASLLTRIKKIREDFKDMKLTVIIQERIRLGPA